MLAADSFLATVIRAPQRLATLSDKEWDILIRQGRRANLLARIAYLARTENIAAAFPPAPHGHLLAADTLANRQAQAIRHELKKIAEALDSAGLRAVLLKGAAYLAADLPCARGRLFADIDLMVPKHQLALAESTLMLHGWAAGHHDEYDQRYYRRWMHEIPPLQHVTRLSIVDLHHAILPETAHTPSPAKPLFEAAIPIPGTPFSVLSPLDMTLHSATHLFHEGEFHNGLRDLCDLDNLLRYFSTKQPDFFQRLVDRAGELNLATPLRHALRYTKQVFDTPVPDAFCPERSALVDALFARALAPDHVSCQDRWAPLSLGLLYLRGHWLRMPPWLLLRHLFHKAFITPKDPASSSRGKVY